MYGILPAAELAILGFGKLCCEVLTRGSDLDLVFVYNAQKKSISNGSSPVEFPDFTRGKWKINKPRFGLYVDY